MVIPANIKPGELVTESYKTRVRPTRNLVEWNYRDAGGQLHAGVVKTFEEAERKASKFGYGYMTRYKMTLHVFRNGFPSMQLLAAYRNLSQDRLDELIDQWDGPGSELSADNNDTEWFLTLPA